MKDWLTEKMRRDAQRARERIASMTDEELRVSFAAAFAPPGAPFEMTPLYKTLTGRGETPWCAPPANDNGAGIPNPSRERREKRSTMTAIVHRDVKPENDARRCALETERDLLGIPRDRLTEEQRQRLADARAYLDAHPGPATRMVLDTLGMCCPHETLLRGNDMVELTCHCGATSVYQSGDCARCGGDALRRHRERGVP